MKPVLSLLTAYILLQTQSWALSGGPVFPTGAPNLAGIYSGVMVQEQRKFGVEFEEPNSGIQPNKDDAAGSIGAYTITIPLTGLATGTAIFFVNGTLYTGVNIDGVADPDKSRFEGVLEGSHGFTTSQGPITVDLLGQMKVRIEEKQGTPLPGRTDTTNGIAARMRGSAKVDVFQFVDTSLAPIPWIQLDYSISGFRQSTTPVP